MAVSLCSTTLSEPGGLVNTLDTGINTPFLKAFFFSIHTSATIGYGSTVPVGLATNILVALESVVSLLGLAVVTGLVFARFSRPVADILFSQNAVMSWIGDLSRLRVPHYQHAQQPDHRSSCAGPGVAL